MTDASHPSPFAAQLLRRDQYLTEHQYKEHRMQLEQALNRTERREKIAMWVAYVTIPLAVVLAFVGGSGVVGSFDPSDPQASVLSVTIAAIYVCCMIAGPVGIASYYTRFRPKIKEIKDQIRDTNIQALHGEIAELRKLVEQLVRGKE